MFKDKKILALVPARSGSKRLPSKNIKPLSGKPLVAWTIEAAKESKYVDKIIVSTDDEKIAEISKRFGAEVPFLRPKELATDDSKTVDVIFHAIEWLRDNKGDVYDLIILLQPTSPLRISEDIDRAIELLFSKKARAVISICETEYHPYWSNTLPANGCMENFIKKEILNKNSQELPVFYRLNGSIYAAYIDYVVEKKGFLGKNTFAYIMPTERSVDIDREADFKLAEILKEDYVEL